MRLVFLNPPYPTPAVRRYMCSYNSPNFLFPPIELMSAAAAARDLAGAATLVVDAVARGLDAADCVKLCREFDADAVVAMPGFEILGPDLETLARIKDGLPGTRLIIFGHLPTLYPEETAAACKADMILMEEPEQTLAEVAAAGFDDAERLAEIMGLALPHSEGGIVISPARDKIKDLDALPRLDYSMVRLGDYSEFGMPNPFAVLQTARGCPYRCAFCVRSYGGGARWRSAPSVVDEVSNLVETHGLRGLRFIDDTFTADRQRCLEICDGLAAQPLGLRWSCLARPDNLDEELVRDLRRAGCRRVYLGIESGSERVLEAWNKRGSTETARRAVGLLHKYKIESCGFFMFGHPDETDAEFRQSVSLALELPLDFLMLTPLTAYPGTELFDRNRDRIDFSLIPFRSRFKDGRPPAALERMEREFYKAFYLRPSYMIRKGLDAVRSPAAFLTSARALMGFLFSGGKSERKSLI